MFKQQLSPRTVHPYQTTVVPRSEQQVASAAQQRAKYPWVEDINPPVYQVAGTDSSTSDNAYHMPHYYNGTTRDYGPPSPVYQSPYDAGSWRNYKKPENILQRAPDPYKYPQCASAFSLPICEVEPHTQVVSRSPIPPVSPEVPIIGACGGHCPGFEYVCYYILQVIFVVGILTGISLCIAGIVLRRTNRNGDLGVLVYIGCLSSCVCGVLLGVQCCVRREIRQRKLRANTHIPMHPIQEQPAPAYPLLTATCDEERRCVKDLEDSWCDGGREIFENRQFNTPGKLVSPRYVERTLSINAADLLDIQYPGPTVQKPNIRIINSTQSTNLKIEVADNKCPNSECTVTIKAVPTTDFCTSDGQPKEYIFVTLRIASFEEVVVKYNVDCGCACSLHVIPKAVICHRHGDYACGTCSCYNGWSGQFCDQAQCENKRGDIQCAHPLKSTVECSGNGHCGPCDTCICDTNAIGAQYFNEEYYCEDLCLRVLTNDCESCFNMTNSTHCSKCGISFQKYSEEVSHEKDIENRNVWVPCSMVVDDCDINYMAMTDANGALQVMIVNSCNDIVAGAIVSDSKVPLILGVLAGVAVIAAVAGFMIWKHMTAVPPLPLNDPQYTNIGAEDCTGENPLYKPPTSSFKNPTYGKW